MCFVINMKDSSIVYYRCSVVPAWFGWEVGEGVQWLFQPTPLNTVNVQSVFNDGHRKYAICYICLMNNVHVNGWWSFSFCQTVNSFHHVGVICN